MRHQLILAAALLLAGSPALAHEKASGAALDCPAMARQSQMLALEGRIQSLRARLDSLDVWVQSFEVDRRRTLDEVKASVEAAARDTSRSQPEIEAAVAAALGRADEEAKTVAASAASVHAEMTTVKTELDSLLQQLHKLAKAPAAPRA